MTVILYRADSRDGLRSIRGERSWTSSREYAERYRSGFYGKTFGGPYLYRAEVDPTSTKVVDLRDADALAELSAQLETIMELAGIDEIPLQAHNFYRAATPLIRSLGWQWLVFPEYGYDEWLHLGTKHVKVAPADDVPRKCPQVGS